MGVLGSVPVALRTVITTIAVLGHGTGIAGLAAAVAGRMRTATRALRSAWHRRQVLARAPSAPAAAPTAVTGIVGASLWRCGTAGRWLGGRAQGTDGGTLTLALRDS